MTKFKLIGVMIMVAMAFVACDSTNAPLAPEMNAPEGSLSKGGKAPVSSETAYACNADGEFVGYNETNNPDYGVYEYTLWAGKHNDAGTVSITNDDNNIYVTYNTNSTADLQEVHVYVWTQAEKDAGMIPTKRPAPGHADYVVENINADAVTVTIPEQIVCGENFYISTHAALISNATDGDEPGEGSNAGETAYAGNADSPACFDATKGAWWGFVNYSVDCFYDISGSVYEDADNSADLEDGEAGFGGITVTLLDADGNVVATTTTNADGSYLFEHVAGGADYTVVSATPEGDYLANENAAGFSIGNLSSDATNVDFGFVPLWDISLAVMVNADCDYDLSVTFDGAAISGADGFYFIENQLPGQDYMIVATATSSEGSVSQSWTGSLTADLTLDFELTVECPVIEYDPCDTNMDGVVDAAEAAACNPGPPNSGDNFPLWGQDISHVVLAFSSSSAPNGDPIDDGFYLIKVDNYPGAGNDDLDNDIDMYLAGLIDMGFLSSSYDLIGSSIKGGRQITSFYYYGSYNTNGEAADEAPAGFPLTYNGTKDNEGNQNQIDVTVDWSAFN